MQVVELIMTKVGAEEIGLSATVHAPAAGILDLGKVHLSIKATPVDEDSVPADFTGANLPGYTGYAAKAITWSGARETSDGEVAFIGTTAEFNPTDAVGSALVKRIGIMNTAGDKLLFVGNLGGTGVPLNSALDTLTPNILFRPQGGSSVEVLP